MPVSGWTGDGEYVTGHGHVHRVSMTDLQKALKPPDTPKEPRGAGRLGCSELSVLALVTITAMLVSYCLLLPSLFGVGFRFFPDLQLESMEGIFFVLTIIALLAIPFVVLFIVWYFLIKRDQKRYAREWTEYTTNHQRWRDAMKRWNRLYYCNRDGIVFDPETNETCDPAQFINFIYQTPKH